MISIREISELEHGQLTKVFGEVVMNEFPEYSERIRTYFIDIILPQELPRKKLRIGAFDNDTLVGFLIAENPFGGVLFVPWLALLSSHQKQGIGTQLLTYIEELALKSGVHSIQLQADERNVPFYTRNDFEVIGLDKKGFFGTDNYLLKKQIQEPNEELFLKH